MTRQTYARPLTFRFLARNGKPGDGTTTQNPPSLTDFLRSTPAAQEEFDRIIEERLSRSTRSRDEGGRFTPKEKEELETLRREKQERERQALEEKGRYDAAVNSIREEYTGKEKSWQQERDELLRDIKHDRVTSNLVVALTTAGAVNPEKAAKLLMDRVTLNDRREVVVLQEDGKTPAFRAGRPLAIKDLVEDAKATDPYLFKAETSGEASGAQGGSGGRSSEGVGDGPQDQDVKDAEDEYAAAKARAEKSGSAADVVSVRQAKRKLDAIKDLKAKKR